MEMGVPLPFFFPVCGLLTCPSNNCQDRARKGKQIYKTGCPSASQSVRP